MASPDRLSRPGGSRLRAIDAVGEHSRQSVAISVGLGARFDAKATAEQRYVRGPTNKRRGSRP